VTLFFMVGQLIYIGNLILGLFKGQKIKWGLLNESHKSMVLSKKYCRIFQSK
jgi:hypothetical protein